MFKRTFTSCLFSAVLMLFAVQGLGSAAEPAGLWRFSDADAPLAATTGADLVLVGEHEVLEGPGGHGAARIGLGSHYRCAHGLAANGGGEKVNQYTIIMDLRTDLNQRFTALLQTDPANEHDNVCEMMSRERAVGIGVTGYSRVDAIPVDIWFRLALVVDNAAGVYDIYVNDERVLHGTGQSVDGRYALDREVLFFADDDGDDNAVEVALIALFGHAASPETLRAFGQKLPLCPTPPEAGALAVNFSELPDAVSTGETLRLAGMAAQRGEATQFRIDWGDGVVDRWSGFLRERGSPTARHSYPLAGAFTVKAQTRGACGWHSGWVALGTVTVAGPPSVTVLTRPFLQNPRTDGMTLMWEANAAVPSVVRYREVASDDGPMREARGEARYSGHGTFIHTAHLEALEPATPYQYEVVLGDGLAAGSGHFRTAPEQFEPFSFGVWADSQGENKGAYAGNRFEPTISMMTHMADSGVAFGFGAGDHAEDGNAYIDTRRFFLERVAEPLGSKAPFFIAWGNHDSYQDAVIRRFAYMPSAERAGFDPGYGSFAVTYADCRFIAIDYASMHTDIAYWLEAELKSPASREARHRFLFVHVPPYCQLWIDGNQMLRDQLVPLMEAYRVDACFSGHTHAYERGYKNGVHYVITGGGSWLDHGEEVVREWPHMRLGGNTPVGGYALGLINEYVRVNVTSDGWNAECLAFEPNGDYIGIIDTFSNKEPNLPGLAQEDS